MKHLKIQSLDPINHYMDLLLYSKGFINWQILFNTDVSLQAIVLGDKGLFILLKKT